MGSNESVQMLTFSSTRTINNSPSDLAQALKTLARPAEPAPIFSSHTSSPSSLCSLCSHNTDLEVFLLTHQARLPLGALAPAASLRLPASPGQLDPFGLSVCGSKGGLPCLFSSGPARLWDSVFLHDLTWYASPTRTGASSLLTLSLHFPQGSPGISPLQPIASAQLWFLNEWTVRESLSYCLLGRTSKDSPGNTSPG